MPHRSPFPPAKRRYLWMRLLQNQSQADPAPNFLPSKNSHTPFMHAKVFFHSHTPISAFSSCQSLLKVYKTLQTEILPLFLFCFVLFLEGESHQRAQYHAPGGWQHLHAASESRAAGALSLRRCLSHDGR